VPPCCVIGRREPRHVIIPARFVQAVCGGAEGLLRVGEAGQEGAATATEVWRRGSRALGESGGAVQHLLAQKRGYLGARGVAVGRRAIHGEEATLGCSLGMAITKPRR
jgi:hypothetical protein